MISVDKFLQCIETNSKRVKRYKLGGDGTNGNCDCIGLDIGALRIAGEKWHWTHGTNYTVRHLLHEPIQENVELHVGDVVFKGHLPGESGYDLPDQYKNGPDQTDYYHVGTVTSTNPLTIIHCTSGSRCRVWDAEKHDWVKATDGGIMFDAERGKWKYSGRLKQVSTDTNNPDNDDQNGGDKMTATVISPNGGKVNMRKEPKTTSAIVVQLNPGAEVEVLGTTNTGWTRCRYGAKYGYVMSQFISGTDPDEAKDAQIEQVKSLLNQALAILNEMG